MGSYTTHYNLYLPDISEHVDLTKFNSDLTTIDTTLASVASNVVVVISDTTPNPSSLPSKYLWIQTGLAPGGTGFTFWIETGA